MKIHKSCCSHIKTGIALLSGIMLFTGALLLPQVTSAATISCSSGVSGCHFSPTVKDGTARNVPTGRFTGSHARHSGYSTSSAKRQYVYACTKCHPSGSYGNAHQTGFKNITGSSLPGNRYSAGKKIANTNTPAFGNCGNIYCHSTGRASGMGQVQYSSARWGGTETCLGCHGGRTAAAGTPARSVGNFSLSTSHSQHLKYPAANINCQTCHPKTATDAATLKSYTGVLHHIDGVREVTFTNIAYGSYTSYKSTENGSSANTRICTNIACHGGKTRGSWSATVQNNDNTCVHCHGVAGTSAALANTAANRKFFAPGWGDTGISTDGIAVNTDKRVGAHFVHLSSVYMSKLKCNECHTVPSTVFDGTHAQTTRFSSQSLSFGQASTARDNSAPAAFVSGTAAAAASCTTVYCHGNNLKNGDTTGTSRSPSWDVNLTTGTPGATECGRCHGNPPTVVGVHSGKTATTSCVGCHAMVVDATGKVIDKTKHVNGTVEATGGDCLGCHSALVSADFVRPSRHVSNGTTTNIVTNFDCIVCHAEGLAAASGVATTTLHSGVNTTTGTVELRNVDNVSTATNGGTVNTNYWVWPNRRANGALAKGSANTTARNNMDTYCLNCHDNNGASGIAVNNSNDGLILSGLNTTVRTVTGTGNTNTLNATVAQRPFNTNDKLQNVNDLSITGGGGTIGAYRLSYGRVLNVKSQFNSGDAVGTAWASHHNLNQYTKRYTSNSTVTGTGMPTTAWTAYVTKESVTMNAAATGGTLAGLHCSDCHLNELNAHGSTNSWYMLNGSSTASDTDIAPLANADSTGTAEITCFRCHAGAAYAVGGTSTIARVAHASRCNNIETTTGTSIESPFGNMCHSCHGGFGDATLAVNKDSIGTGTVTVGRGPLGAIHGNNEDYYPNTGATVSKRYRFMSGAVMRFYGPNGASYGGTTGWEQSTASNCYTIGAAETWSSCSSHDTGGAAATTNRARKLAY